MNRLEYQATRRALRRDKQLGRFEATRRFSGPNAFSPEFKARHERIRNLSLLCRWRRRSAEALAALKAAGADSATVESYRLALRCGARTPHATFRKAEVLRRGWYSTPVDLSESAMVPLVYAAWVAEQQGVAA